MAQKRSGMPVYSFKAEPGLVREFDEVARARGVSRGELLRQLMVKAIALPLPSSPGEMGTSSVSRIAPTDDPRRPSVAASKSESRSER